MGGMTSGQCRIRPPRHDGLYTTVGERCAQAGGPAGASVSPAWPPLRSGNQGGNTAGRGRATACFTATARNAVRTASVLAMGWPGHRSGRSRVGTWPRGGHGRTAMPQTTRAGVHDGVAGASGETPGIGKPSAESFRGSLLRTRQAGRQVPCGVDGRWAIPSACDAISGWLSCRLRASSADLSSRDP